MSGLVLVFSIAGVVICLAIIVVSGIEIKRINRNHALYKIMMDEKERNNSLCWEFLRQNGSRHSKNPMLMLQDPQLREFIEKDRDIIARICALGKTYESVVDLRLENFLKQVALDYESIRGSVPGSPKSIIH